MGNPNKASSPLVDALKLFFRNPTAVIALLLIVGLAGAAISGNIFTGPKPTPSDLEQLETADELGDATSLDVNPTSILDPTKTRLKDTFLPPFSTSRMKKEEWQQELIEGTPEYLRESEAFQRRLEEVEPKVYYLGTDHLGRDVLAQLWAGSTISLMIGFLAVGIAVLLGVSLGGVSGFFGRRSVRLPMLVMLMSALMGAIAMPAEAPVAGYIFFVIAGLAFVYQLVVALMGKRYKPVIGWAVVAVIVFGIFGYNYVIETMTPEGRILQQARNMESVSKDVLLMTRDHGNEVKASENGLEDALSDQELVEDQMELELAYQNMYLEEKRYQLVEYVAGLEIAERTGHEMLERAEHLKAHLDKDQLKELSPDEVAALSSSESRLRARHKGRKGTIDDLTKDGNRRLIHAKATTEVIQPWIENARESIETAEESMDVAGDFDFQSSEARINKLKETQQALHNVDRAVGTLKYVEHLAGALKSEGSRQVGIGEPLVEAVEKARGEASKRVTSIKASLAKTTKDAETKSLNKQLAIAQRELKQLKAALPTAKELQGAGKDLDAQFDLLMKFGTEEGDGAAGVRAQLPGALKAASAQLSKLEPEDDAEKDAIKAQQSHLAKTGAQAAAIQAATQAVNKLDEDAVEMIELVTTPESELTDAQKKQLETYADYDYAGEAPPPNALYFNVQPSVKLLNRRADERAKYLKRYEADASTRFDGQSGLTQSTLLDGSSRYGVFRLTRHFVTVTVLLVILLVASMIVAASAQGAAEDTGGALSKVFIPTINVDDLVMRFTEIMMTIPVIYLILAVLALFERDVYIVMAVIGLTSWMGTTRFVRAEILSLREQDFIQASRALGVSDFRIIWRHLVPNAISPVLVSATLMVATAVLAESTLSFLGIGAGEDQQTWGRILNIGRAYITDASWLTWIPGVAILITVLSFNLLGEGLREAFNPKLRGR